MVLREKKKKKKQEKKRRSYLSSSPLSFSLLFFFQFTRGTVNRREGGVEVYIFWISAVPVIINHRSLRFEKKYVHKNKKKKKKKG